MYYICRKNPLVEIYEIYIYEIQSNNSISMKYRVIIVIAIIARKYFYIVQKDTSPRISSLWTYLFAACLDFEKLFEILNVGW